MINEVVIDWIAVRWAEKQLGRKLTPEEVYGWYPVEVTTQDGVKALLYIEKLPFSFFYPEGYGR
jgi:hypothetical protein